MLNTKIGVLASLSTTDKSSIVAAINEMKTSVTGLADTLNDYSTRLSTAESGVSTNKAELATAKSNISALQSTIAALSTDLDALELVIVNKAAIDDEATATTSVWSSSKVSSAIITAKQDVKNDILGGVGEAYDTLKELYAAIKANKDLIESFQAVAAGHVKFDSAQELTDAQKTQARSNIGAASYIDTEALITRVTNVESKANTTESNLSSLTIQLGNITDADFVATFEAAVNGS
jgi:hypothetical protein